MGIYFSAMHGAVWHRNKGVKYMHFMKIWGAILTSIDHVNLG